MERFNNTDETIKYYYDNISTFLNELNIIYEYEKLYNNYHFHFFIKNLEYLILFDKIGNNTIEIKIGLYLNEMKILYYGVLFTPAKIYIAEKKLTEIKEKVKSLLI